VFGGPKSLQKYYFKARLTTSPSLFIYFDELTQISPSNFKNNTKSKLPLKEGII